MMLGSLAPPGGGSSAVGVEVEEYEDISCPLCTEPLDVTDKSINFCKCGYRLCLWCWHHLMETAQKDNVPGRCPACRTEYDPERITMEKVDPKELEKSKRATKAAQPGNKSINKYSGGEKGGGANGKKHLHNVRVVQRNLVYVVGLPLHICREELLKRPDWFAKYGKIIKVSANRTGSYSSAQNGATGSAYVTYAKEDDALRCIQGISGTVLEGKTLRACFGTTKYCNAFLRGQTCNNPDCLYLHDFGSEEDSFSKEEMLSKYGTKHANFHDATHPMGGPPKPTPMGPNHNLSSGGPSSPSPSHNVTHENAAAAAAHNNHLLHMHHHPSHRPHMHGNHNHHPPHPNAPPPPQPPPPPPPQPPSLAPPRGNQGMIPTHPHMHQGLAPHSQGGAYPLNHHHHPVVVGDGRGGGGGPSSHSSQGGMARGGGGSMPHAPGSRFADVPPQGQRLPMYGQHAGGPPGMWSMNMDPPGVAPPGGESKAGQSLGRNFGMMSIGGGGGGGGMWENNNNNWNTNNAAMMHHHPNAHNSNAPPPPAFFPEANKNGNFHHPPSSSSQTRNGDNHHLHPAQQQGSGHLSNSGGFGNNDTSLSQQWQESQKARQPNFGFGESTNSHGGAASRLPLRESTATTTEGGGGGRGGGGGTKPRQARQSRFAFAQSGDTASNSICGNGNDVNRPLPNQVDGESFFKSFLPNVNVNFSMVQQQTNANTATAVPESIGSMADGGGGGGGAHPPPGFQHNVYRYGHHGQQPHLQRGDYGGPPPPPTGTKQYSATESVYSGGGGAVVDAPLSFHSNNSTRAQQHRDGMVMSGPSPPGFADVPPPSQSQQKHTTSAKQRHHKQHNKSYHGYTHTNTNTDHHNNHLGNTTTTGTTHNTHKQGAKEKAAK